MEFLSLFRRKKEEDPAQYGWVLEYEWNDQRSYSKDFGHHLYQSDAGGWVLDKTPKNGPGVVERIGRLDKIAMELANNLSTLQVVTRTRS